MSLTVKSSRINNCQIFQLQGKILSEEDAEILKEATSNLVLHNVIFDLEALTHINSTGIAVFVKTMTKCRIENGDLLFCAPNQLISTLEYNSILGEKARKQIIDNFSIEHRAEKLLKIV